MPVTPDSVFRDYVTDGVPGSGRHKPIKSEIRELLNTIITGAAGTYRVGEGATGVLSIGDPDFAPETLIYKPAGEAGAVRFAVAAGSLQLHYDNIVLGEGDGSVHPPSITLKLPDHNNVNGGADHPLLAISAVENSSGFPYFAQIAAGKAGNVDLGIAILTNDSAHVSQPKLVIPPGDNAAIGIGVGGPSSAKIGGFLHIHGLSAASAAWMHCTNATTGTDGTDGVAFGLDDDESAVIWNYETTPIRLLIGSIERARLTTTGLGVGGTPAERLHLASSAAGSVITTLRVDALNSASTKTSTLKLAAQDNNAGTIRGLFNVPGPLNGPTPDQAMLDIMVEDGSLRAATIESIHANGGARLLVYNRTGTARITMLGADTPILNLASATGEYRVNGSKVLGARQTGWSAATGTATRTTFATGSVTLPQLAERVKAMIDDLMTHGLLAA